tara:strand:- start:1064 stop:1672 length:609 start_codon:yes stop_codon:yes gene_type:complete
VKAILATPLALAAAITLAPMTATADDQGSFLLGAAVTLDQSNLDDFVDSLNTGVPVGSTDDGLGHNLYLGFKLNPNITLRLGQRRFGDAESDLAGGAGKVELEGDGYYVALDLLYPFTDAFALGATLGNQGIDAKVKVSGPGFSESGSDDARDFFYGVRARYLLGDHGALVAAYERYTFEVDYNDSDDIEFDTFALGLEYTF